MGKANLTDKFSKFNDHWTPKIIGEMNGQYVKIAKAEGEFDWHSHENEDEFFLVHSGELAIHLRDQVIKLGPGECFILPKGVEHKTAAETETHFMMIEPKATQHTGDLQTSQTVEVADQEWI